jgi:hypothetical protein
MINTNVTKLKKLAITDLSIKYAEKVSEGKMKHYSIPISTMFALDGAVDALKKAVGGLYEIEVEEDYRNNTVVDLDSVTPERIRKILNKKPKHMDNFYQYSSPMKGKVNFLLHHLGNLLFKIKGNYFNFLPFNIATRISYSSARKTIDLTTFAIETTEGNIPDALNILNNIVIKNKFKGFMSNIQKIEFADVVGDGKKRFGIFLFAFTDGDVQFGSKYVRYDGYSLDRTLSEYPEIEDICVGTGLTIGVEFNCILGKENIDKKEETND